MWNFVSKNRGFKESTKSRNQVCLHLKMERIHFAERARSFSFTTFLGGKNKREDCPQLGPLQPCNPVAIAIGLIAIILAQRPGETRFNSIWGDRDKVNGANLTEMTWQGKEVTGNSWWIRNSGTARSFSTFQMWKTKNGVFSQIKYEQRMKKLTCYNGKANLKK